MHLLYCCNYDNYPTFIHNISDVKNNLAEKDLVVDSFKVIRTKGKVGSVKYVKPSSIFADRSFKGGAFSAGAVYNRLYSKLSTNQKQSYICKSAIYAH